MHVVLPPAAEAVHYCAPCSVERERHGVIPLERDLGRPEASAGIAVVVLEVVDPPRRPRLCIEDFVVQGAGVARTGELAGGGVHPVKQVLGVKGVRNEFHARRETREVREEVACR